MPRLGPPPGIDRPVPRNNVTGTVIDRPAPVDLITSSAYQRVPVMVYYPRRVNPSTQRGYLMKASYTAVVQQDGEWWIGWVEEIPGVNSQGKTRDELLENLRDALEEALEMNRADAVAAASGSFEEVSIPE
jgi:predicted RNase H-like HicB family nuclease